MAYTFFKARGQAVGKSLCEDDFLDKATEILERAKDVGCEVVLPVDTVIAKEFKAGAKNKVVTGDIEDRLAGYGYWPEDKKAFCQEACRCKNNCLEWSDGCV